MVNIGTLWWSVQVAGAAEAAQEANEAQREFAQTAEKANQANEAVNQSANSMGQYSDAAQDARGRSSRLSGTLGILESALFFVGGSLASVLGISTSLGGAWAALTGAASSLGGAISSLGVSVPSLSGAWASLTGAVSGAAATLASSTAAVFVAAAAIGALIGGIGLAIMEWSGFNDLVRDFGQYIGTVLPQSITDLIIMATSLTLPFQAFALALKELILGAVQGDFVGGVRNAFNTVEGLIQVHIGAWQRMYDRLLGFRRDFWNTVNETFGTSFGGGAQSTAANAGALSGVTSQLPGLASGGMIEQSGMFVGHAGEMVVPADVTRNIQQGGGAVGGGGGGVVIQEVAVSIGDQSLNVRDMSRSDVRRLVDALGPEFGRQVENIIST